MEHQPRRPGYARRYPTEMPDASLERLLNLVPPPQGVCCTGSAAELREVKSTLAELGFTLPLGVPELSMHYGRGAFCSSGFYISIHSVFQRGYAGLVQYNSLVFAGLAKTESPDPYQNMFEVGAYGYDNGGDYDAARLFMDTTGNRDSWRVGLGVPLQRFDLSLIDFLVRIAKDRIHPEGFPESFPDPRFVPQHQNVG